MKTRAISTPGSALIASVVSSAVLTVLAGAMVSTILTRRQTLNQASGWEESVLAADAGIHQALAQLEQGLALNTIPTGTQTFTMTLPHTGETSGSSSVTYTITQKMFASGGAGLQRPYYQVTSSGNVQTGGSRMVSNSAGDLVLRKLSFANRKTSALRRLHAVIKPNYTTDAALTTDGIITLNNHNIVVDSFNSKDNDRSLSAVATTVNGVTTYSGGQPSPTLGYFNTRPGDPLPANVATNSNYVQAGGSTIYGDILTNGGSVANGSNVWGEFRDDYYQPLAPVYAPSWAYATNPDITIGATVPSGNKTKQVTDLTTSTTFRGGTAANPARYYMNSIRLSGSGDVVTFDFGLTANSGTTGTVDPTKNYVEIFVKGDITTKGGGTTDGSFVIINGVNVKIWFAGQNATFGGNGITNNNGTAASLSIYGVNAPTPVPGQAVTLAGSSRFFGTVYAPGADLKLAGGGSDGTFVGALTGKSAFLNGNTQIRYDESLAGTGLIQNFGIISWFEDTKQGGTVFP